MTRCKNQRVVCLGNNREGLTSIWTKIVLWPITVLKNRREIVLPKFANTTWRAETDMRRQQCNGGRSKVPRHHEIWQCDATNKLKVCIIFVQTSTCQIKKEACARCPEVFCHDA